MTDSGLFALCKSLGIDRLHWNPKKTDIVGLCPFHMESRCSFAVSSVKLLYNCYACHARGYLDQMVARLKNIDLPKARQFIGKFGDYSAPEFSAEAMLFAGKREHADSVHAVSEAMYAPYITRARQRKAKEYLCQRGIIYLKTGIPKCGIEFGYDPEQDRVMIPWDDDDGFYGCEGRLREKKEGLARYMPYFGLQKAYHLFKGVSGDKLSKTTYVRGYVVVESSIDSIVVSQLHEYTGYIGIAVAKSLVTAIQLKMLLAIGGPFIIGLDNDDAGHDGGMELERRLASSCVTRRVLWPAKDASRCRPREIVRVLKSSQNWI